MLIHLIKATRTDQTVTIRDEDGHEAELRVWHLRELVVDETEGEGVERERRAA